MSRRAGDMRTYAQDTALPGGKYEDGDIDAEGTAVCRPAFEKSLLMNRDEKLMKRYLSPFLCI
jgi:coenzyme A diphosphatase NUDT7